MACVYISIAGDGASDRFQDVLNRAGFVASDMIEVRTRIRDGVIEKIVRSDCPWVISVFRSFKAMEVNCA
jgi:hypothetical protein